MNNPTKMNPSPEYRQSLEDCKLIHAETKTFSGSFLRPHWPFIEEIIKRLRCQSVLDYGCGKGKQYEWVSPDTGKTLEQMWGVVVTKYDPAYPPFEAEPRGMFDLVICTHTLGAIPIPDLPWVIDELYERANKAIYVAEKLGPDRKKQLTYQKSLPVNWTAQEWAYMLRRDSAVLKNVEVTLATRVRDHRGVIVERQVL